MAQELSTPGPGAEDGRGHSGKRLDFIEFRQRITRLVETLAAKRGSAGAVASDMERVDITLQSDGVAVRFHVADLPWPAACGIVHAFQNCFGRLKPMFAESWSRSSIAFDKASEQEGSYGRAFVREPLRLSFETSILPGRAVVARTPLEDFDEAFEVFVTDAANALLGSPQERPEAHTEERTTWYDKFGRAFEAAGCRVLRDHTLGWRDLTGLSHVRQVLERRVFAPLARETLYRRIASRIMPQHVTPWP